jgi:hypothetical protein
MLTPAVTAESKIPSPGDMPGWVRLTRMMSDVLGAPIAAVPDVRTAATVTFQALRQWDLPRPLVRR